MGDGENLLKLQVCANVMTMTAHRICPNRQTEKALESQNMAVCTPRHVLYKATKPSIVHVRLEPDHCPTATSSRRGPTGPPFVAGDRHTLLLPQLCGLLQCLELIMLWRLAASIRSTAESPSEVLLV